MEWAATLRKLVAAFVAVLGLVGPIADVCACSPASAESCCDESRVARAEAGLDQLDVPPCCCCRAAPDEEATAPAAVVPELSSELRSALDPAVDVASELLAPARRHPTPARPPPGPSPPPQLVHLRPVILLI